MILLMVAGGLCLSRPLDYKRGNSFSNTLGIRVSKRRIIGDASEQALFRFCHSFQDIDSYQAASPKVFEIPFNSANKWQMSIHKVAADENDTKKKGRLLVLKGAPEVVLGMCSHIRVPGGAKKKLKGKYLDEWYDTYKSLGSLGERVLGFAECELDPQKYPPSFDSHYNQEEKNYPTSGLTFVGMISLVDPPRQGVLEAVEQCRTAGIRVVMVTGDHPWTAESIAKKVNIIKEFATRDEIAEMEGIDPSEVPEEQVEAIVVHGQKLHDYTQADWDRVLSKSEIVFARTSPEQKLQIVENLQRLGQIVAVTGDGVNDAPALKKAHIGVAMGQTGSQVAREAAKVILYDDNFASIVRGIKEGRLIFDNLTKTIGYTLTHLPPEIFPIFLNFVFGMPSGLPSILILLIDLGTELAPAISISYEPAEGDIMERPPRDAQKDGIISLPLLLYAYLQAGLIITMSCLLGYFIVFHLNGIPPSFLLNTPYFQGEPYPPFQWNGKIYSSAEQRNIMREVHATWFLTLVMGQVCHIWLMKTRFASFFERGPFTNVVMIFGVIIEISFLLLILYVPGVQGFFGTWNVNSVLWTPWLLSLVLLWTLNELRKMRTRRVPDDWFAKLFKW